MEMKRILLISCTLFIVYSRLEAENVTDSLVTGCSCKSSSTHFCASNGAQERCIPCVELCQSIDEEGTSRFSDDCLAVCKAFVKIYGASILQNGNFVKAGSTLCTVDLITLAISTLSTLVIWELLSSYKLKLFSKHTADILSVAVPNASKKQLRRSGTKPLQNKTKKILSSGPNVKAKTNNEQRRFSERQPVSEDSCGPVVKWDERNKAVLTKNDITKRSIALGQDTFPKQIAADWENTPQTNIETAAAVNAEHENVEDASHQIGFPSSNAETRCPSSAEEKCYRNRTIACVEPSESANSLRISDSYSSSSCNDSFSKQRRCCKNPNLELTENLDEIFSQMLKGKGPKGMINCQFCKPKNCIIMTIVAGSEQAVSTFMRQYLCDCFYHKYFKMITGEPEELLQCPICHEDRCASRGVPSTGLPPNYIGPGSPLLAVPIAKWKQIQHDTSLSNLSQIARRIKSITQVEPQMFSAGGHMIFENRINKRKWAVLLTCCHTLGEGEHIGHEYVFLTEISDPQTKKSNVLEVGTECKGYSSNEHAFDGQCSEYQHMDGLAIFLNHDVMPYLENKIKPVCEENFGSFDSDADLRIFNGSFADLVEQYVVKNGITSGHTCGQVIDKTQTRIAYRCANGTIREENELFYVKVIDGSRNISFASPGDSGSFVVQAQSEPSRPYVYGIVRASIRNPLYDAGGVAVYNTVKCTRLSYCQSYFRDRHDALISFPQCLSIETACNSFACPSLEQGEPHATLSPPPSDLTNTFLPPSVSLEAPTLESLVDFIKIDEEDKFLQADSDAFDNSSPSESISVQYESDIGPADGSLEADRPRRTGHLVNCMPVSTP